MRPTIGRSLAVFSLAIALGVSSAPSRAAAADTSAPTAPRQLSASSTPTQVTLHWGSSKDDVGVTGYRVERCNGAGCTAFGEIGASARTTFVDTAVANGASYRYRVRATDAAGNRSAFSRPADVTVGDGGPPGSPGPPGSDNRAPRAPRSLTAAASGARITLRWSAARDNVGVTGYVVQRCQGASCANFANRAQVGAVTSFVDTGLAGGTTFQYRVRGVDAAGNAGAFSPVASARTQASGNPPPPPPPPPPPGQALSPQAVALTFTQSQQFSTSLSGASWSVDGVPGGSAAVGTISSTGLYSAPDAVGKHTVRAAAGSQAATATGT